MRPLQILINKYTAEKQELEYKIEAEINAQYPNVDIIDGLLTKLAHLNTKNGYLTQLLIDIGHARKHNDISDQSGE